MSKIAACYIRVSTDEQVEYSPESQLIEINKYAAAHGYYIPNEFIFKDEGISGRNVSKRPEFNRMISLAKTKPKPFEALLLWKFSRFARNKTDSVVYKSLLRNQCGIEVISVSENIGEDRGIAVILESMFEAMDEYYSINLSTEVKRSMKMKAERGEPICPAPFGYKNKDKQLVIDDIQAQYVKYIFSSYRSGVGMRTIAQSLANEGIRTKRGNPPDNRFIEYILSNPVYIGKIRWSDGRENNRSRYKHCDEDSTIISQGTHTPIISEELFEEVNKMLEQQKKRYGKYQRPEAEKEWMLRGLLRCDNCGATLTRLSTKSPSAQCHNYSSGKCQISHCITLKKANELVIQGLEEAFNTLNFEVQPIMQDAGKKADIDTLERIIASEKRKLIKIKEAFEEGIDTIEEYKEGKARISENISKFESELQEATVKKLSSKEDFAKKILDTINVLKSNTATEREKNEALRNIVSKIVFVKPDNRLELYFYE